MTNRAEQNRKKERLFMIVTIIGTSLICLLIFEIAVRFLIPQFTFRGRDLCFRYEPFIGIEGIPNKKGIFATNSFNATVTNNNEGFRDYNHDKINYKNKFRIITLGDSFTWGHGVNNDQIYMKVLEKIDSNIETINMGISGTGPPTSLKIYTSRGVHYEHNVVLLGFYMGNDIEVYYPKDHDSPPKWGFDSENNFVLIGKMKSPEEVNKIRQESEEKWSLARKKNLGERIHFWLIRHIQLLTFIDNSRDHFTNLLSGSVLYARILEYLGIEKNVAYGLLDYCRRKDSKDAKYGWKLLTETLKTMKNCAKQMNAKLYVVFIPHQVQTSQELYERTVRQYGHDPSEFDPKKPCRKLAKLCNSLEIDYLDLLHPMKQEILKGNQLYFLRDGHWNANGHIFAAREIYKDLKKRGWLE